jgi:hypothetical protein
MHATQDPPQDTHPACDGCGAPFTPKTTWQRFCGPKCRDAWHRNPNRPGTVDQRLDELERRVAAIEAPMLIQGRGA